MEQHLSYELDGSLHKHPYFQCSDAMSLYEKDVRNYWERKEKGELKEHHWVVIKHGELLIQTPSESKAAELLLTQAGMSLLMQVGHENEVAEL